MSNAYNKYYETENLFGDPVPELIHFFKDYPKKGKVLDLGCGQGRDAIAIARLGYSVVGMDNSKTGIDQMNELAKQEKLDLVGEVADMFKLNSFKGYNFILMDSMFHFAKNDLKNETDFIKRIISGMDKGCIVVFCNLDSGNKIEILEKTIDFETPLNRLENKKIKYTFEDKESGHVSSSDYRLLIVQK